LNINNTVLDGVGFAFTRGRFLELQTTKIAPRRATFTV
jgi:hypothetical protein